MVFYRSFYEALKDLPDSERLQVYDAIFSYGLDQKDAQMTGITSVIWKLIKPNIDANLRRYENGLKGAKAKQKQSKPKAKGKQTGSKPKANVDVDVDKDEDKDVNENKDIYTKFAHLKISVTENKKLIELGYTQDEIIQVYRAIENYAKNKNYKSLYLTAINWLVKNFGKRVPLAQQPAKKPPMTIEEMRGW